MSCFWVHKWSNWGDPKGVPMMHIQHGKKISDCIIDMQTRTCLKCNKIEERRI